MIIGISSSPHESLTLGKSTNGSPFTVSKYLNVMYQSNKLLSKIHSITYLDKESGLNLEFLDSLEFLTRTQSQRKVDSPSTHFSVPSSILHCEVLTHTHMETSECISKLCLHTPTNNYPLATRGACNAGHPREDRPVHPSPKNGQGIPVLGTQTV